MDRSLLEDVVADVFAKHSPPERAVASEDGGWAADLWTIVEDLELPLAGVPEEAGGSGGSLTDVWTILRAAGRNAVPLPIAETGLLAGGLLAAAGLQAVSGPIAVAPVRRGEQLRLQRDRSAAVVSGQATAVPWASVADSIVAIAKDEGGETTVVALPRAACQITPGVSFAGEPLDTVTFEHVSLDGAPAAPLPHADDHLQRRGALAYAVLMLGALERVTDLAIEYAGQREQFGRPISRFQAVQHHLAQIARDVAVARGAVELAMEATESTDEPPLFEIAVAKIACGNAAHAVAARAHQVHGAIGVTKEYPLHTLTRRLWSWRNTYGTEREWAAEIGRLALEAECDLWTLMSSTRMNEDRSPATGIGG